MSRTIKELELIGKILDCHKMLINVYGTDAFKVQIDPYIEVIRETMVNARLGSVEAVLYLLGKGKDDIVPEEQMSFMTMWLSAALVEMEMNSD